MTYEYRTRGTCSRQIRFDLEDGVLTHVEFVDGCPGNTIGVAKLAEGRRAEEIIGLLKGTPCGRKTTSCPDQLAQALELALEKERSEAQA